MDIGALRTWVTFQKAAVTEDEVRNHINTWTDYHRCHATIAAEGESSSREKAAAATTVQDFTMTATVRYCSETAAITTTGYRLVLNGEPYDIVGMDHLGYKKKALKFFCRKVRDRDGQ